MRLIICGAATRPHSDFDVSQLAHKSALASLIAATQVDPAHFLIETIIDEGSENLKQVFARPDGKPVANDTSFGVGYAPYSRLERCVSLAAEILRSAEFKLRFPTAGNDVKVMGHRIDDTIALTIAVAFIDRHVTSVNHYFAIKQEIGTYLRESLPYAAAIQINTLDDSDARDEAGVYLTVSGPSAEMGDCGQVGRGNRVNGLITPGRCMSLEAAASKIALFVSVQTMNTRACKKYRCSSKFSLSKETHTMDTTTRTALVIAFVVVALLLLLFGGGMMTGTLMSGGMMGSGSMGGISWMWLPTLLVVLLAVVLISAIFGKK